MKFVIFRDWEARATLEGRKSQFRRTIKPQPKFIGNTADGRKFYDLGKYGKYFLTDPASNKDFISKCPFKPGDRLAVKEPWKAFEPEIQRLGGSSIFAGARMRVYANPPISGHSIIEYRADGDGGGRWLSSVHMPLWASRLTIEITDVRIQRLCEISEEDAIAEGVTPSIVGQDLEHLKYRAGFQTIWDSRYAKRSPWSRNDWMFAYTYRRVET